MSTISTLDELSRPLRALRLLAVDFPDLPAPVVHVTAIYPDRLALSLHDDGFGAFEAWRTALGIAPDAVDFHVQCDHRTGVLNAHTKYGGADIELTGYTQVPDGARMSGAGVA